MRTRAEPSRSAWRTLQRYGQTCALAACANIWKERVMDDLAERLANLAPEKRALILRQFAQKEGRERSNQDDEQGLVTGPVPLLPVQRQLLTMMAAYHLNYHHYNTCNMLEVAQPLNSELAKQTVCHLLLHHD